MYYLHAETRTLVANQKELRKSGNNISQLFFKLIERSSYDYTATDLSEYPHILSFLVIPAIAHHRRPKPITEATMYPYERHLIERYSGFIDGERIIVNDPNAIVLFRLEHS